MRFAKVGAKGRETPVAMIPDTDLAWDLSQITSDIDGAFLSRWRDHESTIASGSLPQIDVTDIRFGAPIARPHAVYAIGLNYLSHAAEAHMQAPSEPVVFSKAPNSICGPNDDVVLPPGATKGDWEVELGVVISSPAYRLGSESESREVIAGYLLANDVSERVWQLEHGTQWLKGKSFPTANPIGPFLATADEVEPGALSLSLSVNGQQRQAGSTVDMIFSVEHIVWYLSQFVQLEPGDLINTGTPDGVGLGMKPPQFLNDGDVMELAITGLGSQRSRVRIPTK